MSTIARPIYQITYRATDISNCGQPLVSESYMYSVRGHDQKLLHVQRLLNCFA